MSNSGTGSQANSQEGKGTVEGNENWTLVTCFFELPDKGTGYSLDKYKEESNFTLDLDLNMLIFCDNSLLDHITERRQSMKEKTKIYQMKIQDLPYAKYVDQIDRNRREKYKKYPDKRNTSWYFILTVSKFHFLRVAAEIDPFHSSHFAWLDFKYNQKDAQSELVYSALKQNRNLFSCCLINYFPREYAINWPQIYYKLGGACTVAAGFFTAKKDIMTNIANLIEKEFINVIQAGYGHSEQQLMYIVLLKYPDLFDFYVGDYPCILLNYVKPVDLMTTLFCLIPNVIYCQDRDLYARIIKNVKQSDTI